MFDSQLNCCFLDNKMSRPDSKISFDSDSDSGLVNDSANSTGLIKVIICVFLGRDEIKSDKTDIWRMGVDKR